MNHLTSKDSFEEVYEFNKVEELFNTFAHWNDDLNLEGFIFRGHGKEKYKLIPNSLREDNKEDLWKISPLKKDKYPHETEEAQINVEYSILREFYKHSDFKGLKVPVSKHLRENLHKKLSYDHVNRFNIDKWIQDDLLEITSLAQHYGIPTRLLDWTYDPYIAFYFAFHDAIKTEGKLSENLVIFALNKEYLSIFRKLGMNIQFITPHYSENPNLSAQKGLFIHYNKTSIEKGNKEKRCIPIDRTPLDEFIKNKFDNLNNKTFKTLFLKKFIIPCSEAKKGCQILDKMGYDSGNVFPGYSGIAKFILEKHKYK